MNSIEEIIDYCWKCAETAKAQGYTVDALMWKKVASALEGHSCIKWRTTLPDGEHMLFAAPPAVPYNGHASDERIKRLMEQVGLPNSRSLYQAFKQFERELIAPAPEPKKTVDVTEMRLCESERLILHPDQLYRFTVDENCTRCRELAGR